MDIDSIPLEPSRDYQGWADIPERVAYSLAGLLPRNFANMRTQYLIKFRTDANGRATDFVIEGSRLDIRYFSFNLIEELGGGKTIDLRFHNAGLHGFSLSRQIRVDAESALKNGSDIDYRIKQGATALHWAAAKGNLDAVKWLVENSAALNLVDEKGWTPLLLAISNRQGAIVDFLLDAGADVTISLKQGERTASVFELAQQIDDDNITSALAKHRSAPEAFITSFKAKREAQKKRIAELELQEEMRRKEYEQRAIMKSRGEQGCCLMCGRKLGFVARILRKASHKGCAKFTL